MMHIVEQGNGQSFNTIPTDSELQSNGARSFGKCWAAIKDGVAVSYIFMYTPDEIDFNEYRERAQGCLTMLGEVRSGEIVEHQGCRYFVKRQNHKNRSQTKQDTAKVFPTNERPLQRQVTYSREKTW